MDGGVAVLYTIVLAWQLHFAVTKHAVFGQTVDGHPARKGIVLCRMQLSCMVC